MKLRLRAEKGNQNPNDTTRMIDMDNFPTLPVVKNAEKFHESGWQQVEARKSKIDKNKSTGRIYTVIARGFQWKVTKKNVMAFFKGIDIVDGEDGITIVKNGAMEAHVVLASKADRKKAFALHNKLFESRAITSKYNYYNIICELFILSNFFHFFFQSPNWNPKCHSKVQQRFIRLQMYAKFFKFVGVSFF